MAEQFRTHGIIRWAVMIGAVASFLIFVYFAFDTFVNGSTYVTHTPRSLASNLLIPIISTVGLTYISFVMHRTQYMVKGDKLVIKGLIRHKCYHVSEIEQIKEIIHTYPPYIKIRFKGKKWATNFPPLERQKEFIELILAKKEQYSDRMGEKG